MKLRAPIALLAAAAMAAPVGAQDTVSYTLDWIEVAAHSSAPVSAPNGRIDPGEGARVRITALITPGIGSPITYQPPPPPGNGRVAGLLSIYFDLLGTNANGGDWSVNSRNAGGYNWAFGTFGDPQPNGNLNSGQAGQFFYPGFTANPTNPVSGIWSMTWTPSDYTPRVASFQSQAAAASMGQHSAILIAYGEDPRGGDPLYVARYIDGIFGNSGPIPIVPAPGEGVVLGMGLLALTGRRRGLANRAGTTE